MAHHHRPFRPWVYPCLLFFLAGGALIDGQEGPTDYELEHRQECAPLEWTPDTDQEAWDMLVDNGYTDPADDGRTALYRPGCLP